MEAFPTVHAHERWYRHAFRGEWKKGRTWSILFGRLALGSFFLWSGYQKTLVWASGKTATAAFLSGPAVANGPFAGFFTDLAGNWAVEYLVVFGEILVGIALIFGIFTMVGAAAGAIQMLLFTLAMWPIADKSGDNPIVDVRVLYGLMFVMFFFLTPGRFLGVDGIIQSLKFVKAHPRLKRVLERLG